VPNNVPPNVRSCSSRCAVAGVTARNAGKIGIMATGKSNYTHIEIRCGGLVVQIGTETEYPDLVDDLANRALTVFKDTMAHAKENGVDVSDMRLITSDYGDDYEEED
jgi:hypothetical protein